jgi:hypothetical protein
MRSGYRGKSLMIGVVRVGSFYRTKMQKEKQCPRIVNGGQRTMISFRDPTREEILLRQFQLASAFPLALFFLHIWRTRGQLIISLLSRAGKGQN